MEWVGRSGGRGEMRSGGEGGVGRGRRERERGGKEVGVKAPLMDPRYACEMR